MEKTQKTELAVRPELKGQVERQLNIRGIYGIEGNVERDINIPAVPVSPRIPESRRAKFLNDTKETLKGVDLSLDASSEVQEHKLEFRENGKAQELEVFVFGHGASQKEKLGKRKIVISSHGGTISEDGVIGSGYLTMVKELCGDNVIVVAPNHRGSHDHKEKADYSLDSRVADVLVALDFATNELVQEGEDVEIYLLGDSMGGHVVATLARNLTEVDGVILTESAAYSHRAHQTNMVYPGHKFETGNMFEKRLSNDPLWSASPQMVENYVGDKGKVMDSGFDPDNIDGILQQDSHVNYDDSPAYEGIRTYMERNSEGRVLLVSMEADELVAGAVGQYKRTAEGVDANRFTHIITPGGHGSTAPEELLAIKDFIL